ncbi:hypothetical protein DEO72_LG2g2984 [Vigna unguiculata]|uniref:Uncharacterized protein n=1 Tax=Vigna unguiculata TaxID=3917 RepID=A0A4D6L2C5_VIGUN|nr:hypothetical protein DEO72_LG2g2983 [Vigna unguiculata]QCD82644.1 hypothetical protein DEO72_LG2g2984 [Vigna unguiculata]
MISPIRVYNNFPKANKENIRSFPVEPHSATKPHQRHLHQHPLLTCTAYTIIVKHKQIGDYPQGNLLPNLSATTDRARAGTNATDHTPQRQVEFPITNVVHNVTRLPNSSANNSEGQSIWTHPYWPQPAHSHWQHLPTRAQLKGSSCSFAIPSSTRGMPFRAQLEECTCLTPIPSSTQGICSELNSRNPTILPLRHHQKPCRSPYKVQ